MTCIEDIRPMRGGCKSHLMRADDGEHYVLKKLDNPQSRRALPNELVSHFVFRSMGVHNPSIALASVPEPDGRPQLHFASRYPFHPDLTTVYDFLPDRYLATVVNLSDFKGALVCDKWLSNADARQAIFYRARIEGSGAAGAERVGFVTQMVDNGHAFQGKDWTFRDSPVQGVYARPSVYGDEPSVRKFEPWIERMMALKRELIDEALHAMPIEWIAGEEREFFDLLKQFWRRREKVPNLVVQSLCWLRERTMSKAA